MTLHQRIAQLEGRRAAALLAPHAGLIQETKRWSGRSVAAVRAEFTAITRFVLRQPVDAHGTIAAAPLVAWLAARYGMAPAAVWANFLQQMSDEELRELGDPCLARFTDEQLRAFVTACDAQVRGQPLTDEQAGALAAHEAYAADERREPWPRPTRQQERAPWRSNQRSFCPRWRRLRCCRAAFRCGSSAAGRRAAAALAARCTGPIFAGTGARTAGPARSTYDSPMGSPRVKRS